MVADTGDRRMAIGGRPLRHKRFQLRWQLPEESLFGETEQTRVLVVLARPLVSLSQPPEQLEFAFFREGGTVRLVVCVRHKQNYKQAIGQKYNLDVHDEAPELVGFERHQETFFFTRRDGEAKLGLRRMFPVVTGGGGVPAAAAVPAAGAEGVLPAAAAEGVLFGELERLVHQLTVDELEGLLDEPAAAPAAAVPEAAAPAADAPAAAAPEAAAPAAAPAVASASPKSSSKKGATRMGAHETEKFEQFVCQRTGARVDFSEVYNFPAVKHDSDSAVLETEEGSVASANSRRSSPREGCAPAVAPPDDTKSFTDASLPRSLRDESATGDNSSRASSKGAG